MNIYLSRIQPQFCFGESKKLLVFGELISDLPSLDEDEIHEDSFVDEYIFLISSVDPWYGDIIIYIQTLKVPPHLSMYECQHLHHNCKNYLIISDTL